ncbi:MAG TPA: hypothetical protein VF064_05250 [Pyrinomonadaceae bacterium]
MTRRRYFGNPVKCLAVALTVLFGTLVGSEGVQARRQEGETDALLGRLEDSKISLADGIRQAEKAYGRAVSAKFEMKGDKLVLSVYTAKEGLFDDAEHNVLMELIGDATRPQWTPKAEVFEDRPHVARSAMHLTAMQLSKMTLADVIEWAAARRDGTVYSVIPAIREGQIVFDVLVARPGGWSDRLMLDAITGKPFVGRAGPCG